MIYPTAIDILRTIEATLVDKVEPSLSDLSGRSAAATIRHLLRHVILRVEGEGQLLADDIAVLRGLLGQLGDYFAETGKVADAEAIVAALAASAPDPAIYPSLTRLAAESGALRDCLYQALKVLQEMRDAHADDAQYGEIRAAIRRYLVAQVEQDEQLIAPAFYGRGPRR